MPHDELSAAVVCDDADGELVDPESMLDRELLMLVRVGVKTLEKLERSSLIAEFLRLLTGSTGLSVFLVAEVFGLVSSTGEGVLSVSWDGPRWKDDSVSRMLLLLLVVEGVMGVGVGPGSWPNFGNSNWKLTSLMLLITGLPKT